MENIEFLGMPMAFYAGIAFGFLITSVFYAILYKLVTKGEE